jgi:hypothetical protein
MKKIFLSLLFLAISCPVILASPTIYTPELVSPGNNQSGVAPNVLLDWNAVVGTTGLHYIIHLSQDEAFTNPVEFSTDLSRYNMSNLMFGETYYWKVRAVDQTGTSDWTETRAFTVVARPILRRPSNNANNQDANVLLQWDAITGVGNFDYQIDTTADFDSPFAYITSVSGTLKEANAANLLFGTGHYLRLRARHAADTSDWTATTFFNVTSTFNLSRPSDNAVDVVPDAEFQWSTVKGINKYNIYLSQEPELIHYDVYNVLPTATRTKPDTLLFGTTYYWKMSANHSKDTLFSAPRSFTTVGSVTLASPLNNATNVVLQPSLAWEKLTGVLKYELQLASNAGFTDARNYSITATTAAGDEQFKVPLHVLDSAGTYYWRVNAISSRDTSAWSETWNFRCVALGIDDPGSVSGMSVYPSPAKDFVTIRMKNSINATAAIKVLDLLGKTRISRDVQVESGLISNFDLGPLPDGVYMLLIEMNGSTATAKIVVRH